MATRKSSRSRSPRASKAKARRPAAPPRRARKAKRRPASRAARKAAVAERRKRNDPETLRLRTITPGLTVADLQRSISFYTEALRFIVKERWTDEGGNLRGLMLQAGLSELGLTQDDWKKGRDRRKGEGVRLWLETVQDVDAMAARLKAAGHGLTEEPADQPWGGRAFSLDDLDGYHLTIFKG